ncbi:hypothetical protein HP548_12520 [Paenibacillus taichungensis]|uniref:Rad50/SbcC-type AAA domain-containing protein n=1 Tax=Paenibacillus taichungensis TaxID=484184 RepID=A0ABX2MLK5_9BACL|nr:hypothetical protein [Paenibacillus taichungensis]NUU54901.1 hypothetical protein [Paenibacillus taichungensis]
MTITLQEAYHMLTESRQNYGDLKKCEFHIHTPASHDYRLVAKKTYKQLSEKEIVEIAYDHGMFSQDLRDFIMAELELGKYEGAEYQHSLRSTPFSSFKEYLSYQLIAHTLYKNDIEVAVITDHNTIEGYRKLVFALNEYFRNLDQAKSRIKLLLGIEISCSEQIHLVGIFDDFMMKQVEKLIEEHIPSKESGTYETSLSMIDKIEKIGGISYIAHINSSNLRNTTSLYKKTLFNHVALNVIGLTSSDREKQLNIINSYGISKQLDKFCFIYEGDSHEINEIGKKNTWIKMSIVSFGSLKKAFINHKLSVFIDKPTSTNKIIKGLLIDPGKHGYLKKKNGEDPFVINFSSDLNCIIGGRGTGKSTILNVLEVVFTLEANSKSVLQFISRNDLIFIHFVYLENEYLLRFIPQLKKDHIYSDYKPFEEEAIIEEVNSKRVLLKHHWIELYRTNKIGESVNFKMIDDIDEKMGILNGVYRKSYSINNIIEQINNGKIGEFVKEVVFNGLPFKERDIFLKTFEKLPKRRMRKFLEAEIPRIDKSMDARKDSIEASLKEFNSIHRKHFSIVYSPKLNNSFKYIDILVGDFNNRQFLSGYRMTWGGVESFIVAICNKMDFMKFLTLLIQNKFKEIEKQVSILSYQADKNPTFYDVDQNRKYVEQKDITEIYRTIRDKLLFDRERLIMCFQLYFEVIDDFSIMFNTSAKEIVTTIAPIMKDINEISLGQKVVAILTFIFEYGKHFNDNTPLIIDQPEDNLDNQYIYKNLVNSLKQIKNNRQIIVVTHSSTIVTNADAEQVIILDSDSRNGWIEKKGYPDNDVVTKHIINYLEGGEESFKHKIGMYEKVLVKVNKS